MSELEGFSYAVFAVYTLTSAGLLLAGYRLGVTRGPQTDRVLSLAAFALAGLWPLVRLAVGDPMAPDPLEARLDGLTGDLVGHACLASGALTAMMAEVQILTRARVAAMSASEAKAAPMVYRFVAFGRILQLAGLFLVLPGVVQGVLALAAGVVVARDAHGPRDR